MKKLSIFVITLLMFTSVAVVLTSIINNKSANKLNQGIDVYYINTDGAGLKGETYNIIGNSTDDILKNTIELMKVKAKNEKLISAVPEDVELIGSSVEGDIARLNFSSEYYDMKKSDEMYCRGAVIKTVTGLYFVDKVEILVEGEPLKQTNGDPIGPVGSDDLIISGTIEAEPATSVKVITLYFANADGTGLNKEERRVEVNRSQPLEKYVMEELIKGPQAKENMSAIPSDTKVRNISTQDGICYLDLSSEFVTKQNGGANRELLTVYSIVNSLTALDDVRKVQFLIEGERQEEYKGNIEFSQPFDPKDIVVQK